MKQLAWLQTYRIDVYVFFVALLTAVWQFLPSGSTWGIDDRSIVGFCYLCGLIWLYLYNKTTDRVEDSVSQPAEMMSESAHVRLKHFLPILIIGPALILYSADLAVIPYLVYIVIGGLYSYPIYKQFRVKNVFFLKNFWAYLDMFLPIWFGVYIYFPVSMPGQFAEVLVAFAFFYMVGELIWDIRDVDGDRQSKVYTLPVVLGVPITKMIALTFVVIGLAIIGEHNVFNYLVAGVLAGYVVCLQPTSKRIHFHLMLYILSAIILLGVWI